MIDPLVESQPRGRILLVEDDPVLAEIYSLILTRRGFDVLVAGDGAAGLEMALQTSPDLVLLDIRLPKMDGIEVLRAIKEDRTARDIPVVMISNYDDAGSIRSSRELGAKAYLIKVNIDPVELPRLISGWIPA